MIVQDQAMQARLINNDRLLYPQTVKLLSRSMNNDMKVILHVLYYISFLFDESLVCLLIKYIFHVFVTEPFAENLNNMNNNNSNGIGNQANLSLSQLYTPTSAILNLRSGTANFNANRNETGDNNNNNNNNNNENSPDSNEVNDNSLFSNWSINDKKVVLRKILTIFSIVWCLIILFQIIFCLDKIYDGISYRLNGSLNENLRNDNLNFQHIWNVKDAYSTGSMVLSLIGEIKFRSKLSKLISLLIIDFIIISLQLIEILLNYGVGFGLIDRIHQDDTFVGDINADYNENPQYDGYQGNTLIYNIKVHEAIHEIFRD